MKLVIREGWYYSQGDEDAFFGRLKSLPCVTSIRGKPDGLHLTLRAPSEWQLRELIALLFRYGLDMTPLAALKTDRNQRWFFQNRQAYWHAKVFGRARPRRNLRSQVH
jgi:hypothetical protein